MNTQVSESPTRILVPLDGSEFAQRAIGFAVTIGGPNATYLFLHVLPEATEIRGAEGETILSTTQVEELTQDQAAASLAIGRAMLLQVAPDADVETVIRTGDAASLIVNEAQTQGASFIVMASRGRDSKDDADYGSTVDRVVRTSSIPVLVVREGAGDVLGPQVTRIVVPLDGSVRASQAVPVAGRLAKRLGIPVLVITAIDPTRSFPPSLAYEAAQSGAFFEEIVAGMQYELQCVQDQAVRSLTQAGVAADSMLLYGPTIESIIDETSPGDLVVMTSHGRGGSTTWMLGSISEKLLRQARLPIVVLRSQPVPEVTALAVDEAYGLQPVG